MNTNIFRYNRTLVAPRKSRKNIQGIKNLGVSRAKFSALSERKRERYKRVGERMRERYRKARGMRKDGRRRRRR